MAHGAGLPLQRPPTHPRPLLPAEHSPMPWPQQPPDAAELQALLAPLGEQLAAAGDLAGAAECFREARSRIAHGSRLA